MLPAQILQASTNWTEQSTFEMGKAGNPTLHGFSYGLEVLGSQILFFSQGKTRISTANGDTTWKIFFRRNAQSIMPPVHGTDQHTGGYGFYYVSL